MLKRILVFIFLLTNCLLLDASVSTYAKVYIKSHTRWVDHGIIEVIYYSGWELKDQIPSIDIGLLYCYVILDEQGNGELVELEYDVLGSGMVFLNNDLVNLYGGTKMEVRGHSFSGDLLKRYRFVGRDFDGYFNPEHASVMKKKESSGHG